VGARRYNPYRRGELVGGVQKRVVLKLVFLVNFLWLTPLPENNTAAPGVYSDKAEVQVAVEHR